MFIKLRIHRGEGGIFDEVMREIRDWWPRAVRSSGDCYDFRFSSRLQPTYCADSAAFLPRRERNSTFSTVMCFSHCCEASTERER